MACLLVPCSANVSGPSYTPAFRAAGLADGGSGHADTVNHCPTKAAADSDLRDHAVRLRKRRERHCLRRCCDGNGEASNSNQSDHSAPPLTGFVGRAPRTLSKYPHSAKRALIFVTPKEEADVRAALAAGAGICRTGEATWLLNRRGS